MVLFGINFLFVLMFSHIRMFCSFFPHPAIIQEFLLSFFRFLVSDAGPRNLWNFAGQADNNDVCAVIHWRQSHTGVVDWCCWATITDYNRYNMDLSVLLLLYHSFMYPMPWQIFAADKHYYHTQTKHTDKIPKQPERSSSIVSNLCETFLILSRLKTSRNMGRNFQQSSHYPKNSRSGERPSDQKGKPLHISLHHLID